MPDLDDLILTLDRLHDVLGERPALWRTTTGIEVTQAIQHYRSREHLTDPADRAPDNAATLVAYKAAIVRAYVRPPIGKSTGDAVGGTLLVERQDGIFGAYSTVTTLAPWLWPTVTPVEARRPRRPRTGDGAEPARAHPRRRADDRRAGVLRMMPVQQTGSFASTPTLPWTRPLDDARTKPGACTTNWNALRTSLAATRVADGNRADVVSYGLLPTGMPVNVPGCGVGGLGSARWAAP